MSARELRRVGKHMRPRIIVIGDRIDVEKHRARNMGGEIVVDRQRQHARQFEGRIDNTHLGVVDMGGEPVGGDKRIVGG